MHDYVKLMTKRAQENTNKALEEITKIEYEILNTLDDQKITAMIKVQRDKIRSHYGHWLENKNKQFQKLEDEIKGKLLERDDSLEKIEQL